MRVKSWKMILLGLLLIAAALCLMAYNKLESNHAGKESEAALAALRVEVPDLGAAARSEIAPTPTPMPLELEELEELYAEVEIPDYILNPNMDMPVKEHEGNDYIAVLYLPSLELELPVISEWDYDRLHVAPCRYSGSAYTKDLVIAGHAYETHFWPLHRMQLGDEVYLTDMDGNVFKYTVAEVLTLKDTDISEMVNSDFALSLFTCTGAGSRARLTIRCDPA